MYVAVGDGGTVAHSSDGLSWTLGTSNVSVRLNAIWHNGSTWIAVGEAGTIVRSTDGTVWDEQDSGVSVELRGVHFAGPGVWLAVGDEGTLLMSTNGTTWAAAVDPDVFEVDGEIPGSPPTPITYIANLQHVWMDKWDCHWVVPGGDGEVFRTTVPAATSGWEMVGVNDIDLDEDGDPNNRTWLAAHSDDEGLILVAGAVNGIVYSEDGGETWERIDGDLATYAAANNIQDIDWSPDLRIWVATIGGGAGGAWFSSEDPQSGDWPVVDEEDNLSLQGTVWSVDDEQFVSVGNQGIVYTSDNGTSWTRRVDQGTLTASTLRDVAVTLDARLCPDCPPYAPAEQVEEPAFRGRRQNAVARGVVAQNGVNQTSSFDDNMWCRDRGVVRVLEKTNRVGTRG